MSFGIAIRNFRCFEAVYEKRALVDYDFQKLHYCLVGADILGDWQGEVMIWDILKEEF
jgi:hypothetical protein